jgi:hypothetical protein
MILAVLSSQFYHKFRTVAIEQLCTALASGVIFGLDDDRMLWQCLFCGRALPIHKCLLKGLSPQHDNPLFPRSPNIFRPASATSWRAEAGAKSNSPCSCPQTGAGLTYQETGMSAQIYEFPKNRRRPVPKYRPEIPTSEAAIAAEYRSRRFENAMGAVTCFLIAFLAFFVAFVLFYIAAAGGSDLGILLSAIAMSACLGAAIRAGAQHVVEYRTLELEYRYARAEGCTGRN